MHSPTVSGPSGTPDPEAAAQVPRRLAAVRRRVADAAQRVGRSPQAVTVVAVSKGFPAVVVQAAVADGQVDLGESRADELLDKARAIGPDVRWHFVGRLQRNKVRDVVPVAGLVHSVDRLSLAETIARRMDTPERTGHGQRVLVQVNAGEDPAKAGCTPGEAGDLVAALRSLPAIRCEGLMTIPPMGVDPRPTFVRLRHLRNELAERFPEIEHLSMGMSGDFEVAVEEGATIVRIGEAVFGPRVRPGVRSTRKDGVT
ncbi:MAG: YggS family pyridoxal phosphate-dependent enzyme [Egibacteraceae bacterium]